MDRLALYHRAPVVVQDTVATVYGARELVRRHAGDYRRMVAALEARQWWDPERLAVDQSERLRAMVAFCAERVPHYRELFATLGLDPRDVRTPQDLVALPLLDKEQVRVAPERFLPDPPRPRLVPQTTGGTTGTPLRYWATLGAVRRNYATYEARARRWTGARLGDRMASFQGQPVVPAGTTAPPFWRRNRAFNQLYCSVYHLADDTLPAYVDELERFDPRVVVGYPSAVHRVAAHLLRTGDVGRVRPRAVVVSGETLLPAVRDDLEAAFGARVGSSYGLGELVAYASACPAGSMHVSTEYGVVELVDTDGSGATELVGTGLINPGMPLLRYRTGDRATAGEGACPCGRGLPTLGDLEGRVDDVVRTPEGVEVGPAPMSLALQRVPHLRRTQVRQERVEELRVLVEVDPDWSHDDEGFLVEQLALRLGPSIRVLVEVVDALPRTSGGKERLVVSSLAAGSR